MHFIRTGSFDIAQTFYNVSSVLSRNVSIFFNTPTLTQECGVPPDPRLWHAFEEMHRIRACLRERDIGPALGYVFELYLYTTAHVRILPVAGPL